MKVHYRSNRARCNKRWWLLINSDVHCLVLVRQEYNVVPVTRTKKIRNKSKSNIKTECLWTKKHKTNVYCSEQLWASRSDFVCKISSFNLLVYYLVRLVLWFYVFFSTNKQTADVLLLILVRVVCGIINSMRHIFRVYFVKSFDRFL